MIQIRNMIWGHSNHGTSNSLKASSPGSSCGWVEKGRRACHYVSGIIWIPPSIPLRLHVNWAVNQSERQSVWTGKSTNVNKYWTTRAKGNDVITDVISTNQHFASTFSMQISKFQRHNCKLSFLFLPHCQSAPESFACRLYIKWTDESFPRVDLLVPLTCYDLNTPGLVH